MTIPDHKDDPTLAIVAQRAKAALEILAEGDAPLKDRLFDAWNQQLSHLQKEPMCPPYRKTFDLITWIVGDGTSTKNLTLDEARDLAAMIVYFVLDIEMAIGDQS